MLDANLFPRQIEVVPYDSGFVLRVGRTTTFYADLENLARAIYPRVRPELSRLPPCAGSC